MYINAEPNETGNYGNPQSADFRGAIALPDDLLEDYIAARGFVDLTIEESAVTALEVNQEALDVYLANHPDEPETERASQLDRVEAQVMYTALMTDTLLEEA